MKQQGLLLQACSFCTSCNLFVISAKVCFDDRRIALNLSRVSACYNAAVVKHHKPFADSHDKMHVVLYKQNGKIEFLSDERNELHELLCFLTVHTGSRFIKQKQRWVACKCAHYFKFALFAVRKVPCKFVFFVVNMKQREQLLSSLSHKLFVATEFRSAKQHVYWVHCAALMQRDAHIVAHGERAKQAYVLECTRNAQIVQLCR